MISQKTKSSLTLAIGTVLVVLGTLFLVAQASGYAIDILNFEISSTSLIKLNTSPTGASIKINSKQLRQKTPYQLENVKPGEITIDYLKDGYHDWQARYTAVGGVVTFADYALLIPKNITPKTISSDVKTTSFISSGNNEKLFTTSASPVTIYEVSNTQLKKLVELPLNNSLAPASSVADAVSNHDGTAMTLKASYPDGKKVSFWVGLSNQSVVNIDNIVSEPYAQAIIDPRNSKDIFALAASQLIRLNVDSRSVTKLGPSNINSLFVDKNYIYTLENRNPATAGQVLIRYEHNGSNRMQLMEFSPFNGSVWSIKSARLGGLDYLAVLNPSNGELTAVRIDGEKVTSSLLGLGSSQVNFSERGRFLSFYQSQYLRTIDLEYILRFKTNVEGISGLKWFTDYQMLFVKPDGLYIIDYNGFNAVKIPADSNAGGAIQYSSSLVNKTVYFLNDSKIFYYSLQPKNQFINF